MLFLFSRFRLLSVLQRHGRLAYRLMRDPRTPLPAKAIMAGTVVFVVSPANWVPNFIPVLGQMEDVALLTLGMEMFFKAVPAWLKAEHEAALADPRASHDRVIDV